MADYVNSSTLDITLSSDVLNSPWVTISRADALTALAIPQHYRKWVTDHVEEMTTGEKATVDAAIATSAEAERVSSYDSRAPRGIFRAIIKPSSTTRTATTTLAVDPHLVFPAVAGGKYRFWFSVFFDTPAAADFKIAMTGPASPVGIRFARHCIAAGATAFSGIGVTTAYNGGGLAVTGTGSANGYCEGHGILANGSNAGDVGIMWAQNTSDAGNTVVIEGSMLWYARIG